MVADAWKNLTVENLRNAQIKLWVVSKELENEKGTNQNNINDFVDLFNDIPGFYDCKYDDVNMIG